jgi:NADPH:quinone reductase-like Zn-dependent oxidoreductase
VRTSANLAPTRWGDAEEDRDRALAADLQLLARMKAMVRHAYGSPEVVQLEELPTPAPRNDEVLVKVRAASGNPADWHVLRGAPIIMRLMGFGLLRPKRPTLGADVAGTVEAIGPDVKDLAVRDEVFGDISGCGWGAFAEYVCVHERALVRKPASITFEQAAAVPLAAVTAVHALREGRIRAGAKVLINGASGGVGTFAVQIAKALGAEVTGVCSAKNVDLVRSIGADHVIDYTGEDFTRGGERYDLIVDAAAFRPVSDCLRALRSDGTYVHVGGTTNGMLGAAFASLRGSILGNKHVRVLMSKPDREALLFVKDLLETGKIVPVLDKRYSLRDVPEAIRYLEGGHARGKVVIAV